MDGRSPDCPSFLDFEPAEEQRRAASTPDISYLKATSPPPSGAHQLYQLADIICSYYIVTLRCQRRHSVRQAIGQSQKEILTRCERLPSKLFINKAHIRFFWPAFKACGTTRFSKNEA